MLLILLLTATEKTDVEESKASVSEETTDQTEETSATDPDGNNLTYKWTVSGGAVNNDAANPMKWTTPNAAGGYIAFGGIPINAGVCLYPGDEPTNKWVVGFISFDITVLTNATIQNASLTFNVKNKYGDPSFYTSFCVYASFWGTVPISIATCSLPGTPIQYINSTTDGNFTVNNAALKTKLQAAINAGHPRFQIGVSLQGAVTNSNNSRDGIEWDQSGIALNITFIPGS